jgi:8-oxo-dGTP pyrophosphatase MutT (NUDIX family)
MARMKTTRAESAGGVVLRGAPGTWEVALVGRIEPESWALPKGTPKTGESREETAIRETQEETGLEVRILEPIDSITYWFVMRHVRVCKTVYYYLMAATGGDLSRHDPEYDRVAWFPVQEALKVMSYPNEVEVLRAALRLVDRRSNAATR